MEVVYIFLALAVVMGLLALLWPKGSVTKEQLLEDDPTVPSSRLKMKVETNRMAHQAGYVSEQERLKKTILDADLTAHHHQQEQELKDKQHEQVIATLDNLTTVTKEATGRLLDPQIYLSIQQKYEFDKLDLDKRWKEIEQNMKAGFIYQLQAHQHLELLKEYLFKRYTERKALLRSNDWALDDKLKLLNEHIAAIEEDFRGRQRLLQIDNRQDLRGGDEDSDSGRGNQSSIPTIQEQLPPKRTRGRPRKHVAE